eukprot:TRINITY_DN67023_c6_g9_i1.p1 TRINITY_DN67023_c6_g9~~TRINITY_DN67023_c6_g9_i1.p1  ORF type:complete len:333 (+),score=181.41 TRINITY_DN67023_c6_g9_i1:81-1079(+)
MSEEEKQPTTVTLASGDKMPLVGLGTWKAKKGEVGAAVKAAIGCGYRHIDGASNYLNEMEVGDALAEVFKGGNLARKDVWITGKLNNPYHHKEHVRPHLEKTLLDLGVEYLDLWLMHWPVAFVYVPYKAGVRGFDDTYDPDGCSGVDLSANGGSKIDMSVSIRETWEAMEACQRAGLVKNIGVCNFTAPLIHDLLTYATIKPAVNQVEMHPLLQQPALVKYCQAQNIAVTAYSPLGTADFKQPHEPSVLGDETLKKIADKHKQSVAQVALRFNVQRGVIVIPKSTNPDHIKDNLNVFDFTLDDDDMSTIAAMDRNYHFLRPQDWYGIPLFAN